MQPQGKEAIDPTEFKEKIKARNRTTHNARQNERHEPCHVFRMKFKATHDLISFCGS